MADELKREKIMDHIENEIADNPSELEENSLTFDCTDETKEERLCDREPGNRPSDRRSTRNCVGKQEADTGSGRKKAESGCKGILGVALGVLCAGLLLYHTVLLREVQKNVRQNTQTPVIQQGSDVSLEGDAVFQGQMSVDAQTLKNHMKDLLEEGTSTIALLREMYPEYVVLPERNAYKFYKINDTLEKNQLKNDQIHITEDGEFQYVAGEKVISKKGIDVSKYQGEIDWERVAADGVAFAFLRLGYRGYGTGEIVLDEYFHKNMQGAKAAGIQVGVYFFSHAVSEEEAVEEAEFVLKEIAAYNLDYPIVFDTEDIPDEESRMDGMTPAEITDAAIAFCEKIKEHGYEPMIYANLRWSITSLEMERLESYQKWFAYYDRKVYFPYRFDIWQYTESGTVDGIQGPVDMNIHVEFE